MTGEKTDFTQGSILRKLCLFMLPVLGALILQAAYGAVDLLVVGRFGSTSGLSAVSTGSQVLNLVTFVVTQLAMGVTLTASYVRICGGGTFFIVAYNLLSAIFRRLGDSRSPISLLEMGLYARSGKLFVACSPDYYRYDNVRITCRRYGVPLYDSLTALLDDLPQQSDE